MTEPASGRIPELPGNLADLLLKWYAESARVLPWRENQDPYRVWISEIMLQQTRVESVIPYYKRFLAEAPDVASLAELPEERLLKLWEGLGYYSRAKHLQSAARMIVSEFGGHFPDTPETIRLLPGIGAYTSGAILSIAFEAATPAVDGNVLRVCTRLLEDSGDISKIPVRQRISSALSRCYPARGKRGDFTQSLMELGATICLPNGAPLCGKCPLSGICGAFRHDTISCYPVLPKKKPRTILNKTVFLLRSDTGAYAIRKRPPRGLLAGLWEFPNTDGVLTVEQGLSFLRENGCSCSGLTQTGRGKHIFSHLEWHMTVLGGIAGTLPDDWIFAAPEALSSEYSLPTAFRNLLKFG